LIIYFFLGVSVTPSHFILGALQQASERYRPTSRAFIETFMLSMDASMRLLPLNSLGLTMLRLPDPLIGWCHIAHGQFRCDAQLVRPHLRAAHQRHGDGRVDLPHAGCARREALGKGGKGTQGAETYAAHH
jgi:hypothetical protein